MEKALTEQNLFREQVQIERKTFSLDLKENARGRFLKITEDVGGRRDTVIIPATGLGQIRDIIDKAVKMCADMGGPASK